MKTQSPENRDSVGDRTPIGIGIRMFAVIPFLVGLSLCAGAQVHGADGTIYYNRISSSSPIPTVRAIHADGTNDRPVPIALPFAANPTVSRDGRQLLVTSADPILFNQMISQNVYRVDLATGATTPISHYVDTLSDGITTYINEFNEPDFDTYSYYTSHFPNYKVFSPTGDRVAILGLTSVSGKQPGGVRLPATQSPLLEVYPVRQTSPLGEFLYAGAERTGVNQTGDGVDWHPTLNQLVCAFRQDIPSFSNLGEGSTEGTVITVFNASGLNPFVRNLSAPTGNAYYDFDNFFNISETEQDYAPAISRDGGRVAYVRNTLLSDSRVGLPGAFELNSSSIRVINYDGSGDDELLRFGPGVWVTKLAWSPDDTEIAFDLAPQLVVDGLKLQMGNALQSEIGIVRVSDRSVRLLAPAPAAFPTWSPLSSTPEAIQLPEVRISRTGNRVDLELSKLVIGRQFDVESSTDLVQWTTAETFSATTATRAVSITKSPQNTAEFYRIRAR